LAEFQRLGVQVVGVSTDSLATLARFQRAESAPQRFVSDPNGTFAKAYGVNLSALHKTYAKRVTFVVGKDGKILFNVLDWSPLGNVNKTLDWLKGHPQT